MPELVNRRTVEVGHARVTVRGSSAWVVTDADVLRNKLILAMGKEVTEGEKVFFRVTDLEAGRLGTFILMLLNTEKVDGNLGFVWPAPSAPAEDLVKAFTQVGDCLTADQLETWIEAIRAADQPPGDPDLFPGAAEGESKRPKP